MNSSKPKKVLVTGSFNVIHPGHLRLLRFAKECGTELIVGVQSDRLANGSAHVLEDLRLEGVQSIGWVSRAFIFDDSVIEIIEREHPDVVVKGQEHEGAYNVEAAVLERYGGTLLFSSGEALFSSLDLIRKEFQQIDTRTIALPTSYLLRHQIQIDDLKRHLAQFAHLNVCVVGDLIVDEYITCEPLGMSQEDPTIVVTPLDSTRFVGGAGIVAAHAAGLGAQVTLVSVSGRDDTRNIALNHLVDAGVNARVLTDDTRPTTLKQRFRSKGKSLLRVSHLHQAAISSDLQQQLYSDVDQALYKADLLVFSDFNYGCLPQKLVDRIISLAKSRGVHLAADSQSSSQIGDIGRFKGVDLITPTEREARISVRSQEGGLVVLAEQLRQQTAVTNILLKMGEEGLLIHAANERTEAWATDRVPALNSVAKDVAGAGDSLLIASAMTLACGGSIWEAACLGSLAAAVQVGRVGNTPLRTNDLTRELVR